jgi:hypothetical protein
MNETRAEPIKDANLPCTIQSIPSRENEDVCDFVHLLDSDDFSNEHMKDVDNFIPELESLLQNLEDKPITVNSGNVSSVGSDLMELNDELLTDSDLNKFNTALSAFSDIKTLNSGFSIDSFAPQVEEKPVNNVIFEVQPKVLLPDVEENKDHNFVMTESCQLGSTDPSTKWSGTGSYLEDTMDRYVTACSENQNQEMALTFLCVKSKHNGSTAVRPPLLNRSTSPAAKTTQYLNISQHAGDSETVATNDSSMDDGPGSVSGGIPLQLATKRSLRTDEISNLKTANLVLQEKSCGQLSHTEILHSLTNSNKTAVENRRDIMTSEVGMSGVTPYLMREVQDHTYSKVKDEQFISTSKEEPFEFPTHDEISHSFSFVDNTVTGKSVGDIAIEVNIPGLTASAMSEVLANSERSNGPEITVGSEAISKKSLSSAFVAASTQKRAKDDMTASQAEQNNCTKIPALPLGSFFQKKGSTFCNNQQNKLFIKETNIDKTCSSLKSQISFAQNKRDKFAGFTFEKPVVPEQVPGRSGIKNNGSKTKRASKSTKKRQRPKKALPSLTSHASTEPSSPCTSNTNSSNVLKLESQCNIEGNQVEETNDLHCTYVNKEHDLESPNWIQELLM